MLDNVPVVVDLHEDIAFYFQSYGAGQAYGDYGEDLEGRQADIPKYRRANVRLVFAALFPAVDVYGASPPGRRGRWFSYPTLASSRSVVLDQFKTYYNLARRHGITLVEDSRSLEEVIGSDAWRLGFVLHLEGADPLGDPGDLELLYRLGLRSLGLTWNWDNKYAASCTTRRDYGLTPLGEELVEEAERLGILIDLAHASDRTALDVINASRKPVVISHGGLRSRVDTGRNTGWEVLDALAANDGVFGVTFISSLIRSSGRPTIGDVVDIIVDLVERYGDRLPALGTDYHGLLYQEPPMGLESIDRLPVLAGMLAERGLGDNSIRRVMGENALRVLRERLV